MSYAVRPGQATYGQPISTQPPYTSSGQPTVLTSPRSGVASTSYRGVMISTNGAQVRTAPAPTAAGSVVYTQASAQSPITVPHPMRTASANSSAAKPVSMQAARPVDNGVPLQSPLVASTGQNGTSMAKQPDMFKMAATKAPPMGKMDTDCFSKGPLSIVILGASGDLAKKKTYPSLMDLFLNKFLPPWVSIVGYARSGQTSEDFRGKLKPWLLKVQSDEGKVDDFLDRCTYFKGAYDSAEDFAKLNQTLCELEGFSAQSARGMEQPGVANRLYYFAIPPDAFLSSATSIRSAAMSDTGFTRLIVEKPFGHDYKSAEKLVADLGALFSEEYIYRIDHYLAKELVQNLYLFRFGNTFLEPAFNNHFISNIQITFKEPFGTEGRGGYFTNYGIIRDVIQNHLMQVLAIVAMEPPPRIQGEDAGMFIRDAKNNVLRCISPIHPDEVVIGQYVGADGKPGYLEDDSIKDDLKEKAKIVPTFAAVVLRINNPRWAGVPFVLKAGKALNERKVDVRVQYKEAAGSTYMFGERCARNELVMRLQPDESVYMKINVKEPGLATKPIQSELDLSYKARYNDVYNPDAYTRLILEALRGAQGNFVRSDELLNSWKIFDPLLEHLEQTEKRIPTKYKYGSRGPKEADDLMESVAGFKHEKGYVWQSPSLRT